MVEWNNGATTAKYAYVQNLQGDIVGIIDSLGNEVVKYTYDAWGKPLSCTGTMAASLGKLNPFRYRGYVYDEETGLYYLRSRFYNPYWNRFVNADTLIGINKILSHNLFAYCSNRCICYADSSGFEETECIIWYIRCAPDKEIEIADGIKVKRGDVIVTNGSRGDTTHRCITLADGREGEINQRYITNQKPWTIADVYGVPEMGSGGEIYFGHVKNLQIDLKILGYYDGDIDGVYGEKTAAAVIAFGEAEKLGTKQYAGPKIKNRLFEIMYERYDNLQDMISQSYWNGYNDHRQEAKE